MAIVHFLLLKLGYSNKTNNPNASPSKRMFGLFSCGRSDRIRTCDFVVPNDALYQTEPHPEKICCFATAISIIQKRRNVKGKKQKETPASKKKRAFIVIFLNIIIYVSFNYNFSRVYYITKIEKCKVMTKE